MYTAKPIPSMNGVIQFEGILKAGTIFDGPGLRGNTMSKIETDKYHLQRHNTAVILQKSPYESLLGINRFLFFVILMTMAGVLLLGFLLLPKDEG